MRPPLKLFVCLSQSPWHLPRGQKHREACHCCRGAQRNSRQRLQNIREPIPGVSPKDQHLDAFPKQVGEMQWRCPLGRSASKFWRSEGDLSSSASQMRVLPLPPSNWQSLPLSTCASMGKVVTPVFAATSFKSLTPPPLAGSSLKLEIVPVPARAVRRRAPQITASAGQQTPAQPCN